MIIIGAIGGYYRMEKNKRDKRDKKNIKGYWYADDEGYDYSKTPEENKKIKEKKRLKYIEENPDMEELENLSNWGGGKKWG